MEEKIKQHNFELFIIISFTILVTFIAGFISQNSNLWFLPLIGGIVAVIGDGFKHKWLINIGICTGILSFFFLNYTLTFTITNLSILLIIFTLIMTTWVFSRNYLITSQIKQDLIEEENDDIRYLKEFKLQSNMNILKDLLIAFLIASTGSFIALYSYTDIFMISSLAVPLAVIFSAAVFGIVYILIEVLPKYLKDEESQK